MLSETAVPTISPDSGHVTQPHPAVPVCSEFSEGCLSLLHFGLWGFWVFDFCFYGFPLFMIWKTSKNVQAPEVSWRCVFLHGVASNVNIYSLKISTLLSLPFVFSFPFKTRYLSIFMGMYTLLWSQLWSKQRHKETSRVLLGKSVQLDKVQSKGLTLEYQDTLKVVASPCLEKGLSSHFTHAPPSGISVGLPGQSPVGEQADCLPCLSVSQLRCIVVLTPDLTGISWQEVRKWNHSPPLLFWFRS